MPTHGSPSRLPSLASRTVFALCLLIALQFLAACSAGPNPADPWENTNRFFYKFDDTLDKYTLKPCSEFYVRVIPKPVRTGLNNGFNNLQYFDVVLNDFLQANWNRGWSDAGRMTVNSTLGVAGILDPATTMGLPIHENDFGITLGRWGAKAGPYLVLPLFGPSCGRDAPSIPVGILDNPITWVNPPWYIGLSLNFVNAVDSRANAEHYFKFRRAAALDDYAFTRDAYLQYRQNQISGGTAAPDNSFYDEDVAPASAPAAPATPAATAPAPHPK